MRRCGRLQSLRIHTEPIILSPITAAVRQGTHLLPPVNGPFSVTRSTDRTDAEAHTSDKPTVPLLGNAAAQQNT